jgi:hypothetical protein
MVVDAHTGERVAGSGCCRGRISMVEAINLHNYATRTNVSGTEQVRAMNRFATYGALIGKLAADHPNVFTGRSFIFLLFHHIDSILTNTCRH